MIVRPVVCRPLIGRQADLDYLNERRREAASSRGGLVFVSGAAGVGKTRLIGELRATLAKSRLRVGVGRCLEFAQRPYGPILDILEHFDPAAPDLQPAVSKREQFDTFVQSFERAAAKTALLAVVEDLHWADAATLELLAYLCGRLDSMRLLVIASYRDDELHADHPTLAAIAKMTRATRVGRVHLTPLSGPDLRAFIDEALSGIDLPNDVRREVARTSEGNPFFAVELLKRAVQRPGARAPAGSDRRLPVTVRAAVMERLRPLAGEDRSVLAQAAIIGRRFDIELLRDTLDIPSDTLLAVLARARGFQLVEEETPTVFRFRHALTRDAIYGDFLASQVRPMHRRIATALEALPEERRSVESLAYHWWAAGDRANAARYNELAGDAAARLFAHQDAIVSYERAFESIDAPSRDRARVLEKIARRYVSSGFNDQALRTFARAAEILHLLGDSDAEAALRVRAAVQAYRLGDANPTTALEAMLERCSDRDEVARTRLHLGIAHIAGLRYRPSEAARHLDLADPAVIANDADLRYSYRAARALVTYILGDADQFVAEIEGWLDAARETNEPASIALVHFNSGMYLSNLARHDQAESHFVRAFGVAREQRDRMAESAAYAMHARALLARGDLHGVRRCVDAVHELRTDSEIATAHAAAWGTLAGLYLDDDRLIERWFDGLYGRIASALAFMYAPGYAALLVRRGRPEEARALLHVASRNGERPRGMVMTFLAVAQFGASDDFGPSRSSLERASDAPVETPEKPALALFDAYVDRRNGDRERAEAHARVAVEGFARLRYPLLEAAAREIAGDGSGARAMFAQLGALGELRRLDGSGERRSSTDPVRSQPAASRADVLSAREREIATLVARGHGNLEIARDLAISHKTVEKHVSSIYQKLGFTSRAQLASYVSSGG
ncbi:MAG: helix-turn-helix transcriptional regulator [Candidatus Elarobacter sp.]